MKVTIEATQDEFEAKRDSLSRLIKSGAKSALDPRRSVLTSQNEVFDFWDAKFNAMIESLKEEIGQILSE